MLIATLHVDNLSAIIVFELLAEDGLWSVVYHGCWRWEGSTLYPWQQLWNQGLTEHKHILIGRKIFGLEKETR